MDEARSGPVRTQEATRSPVDGLVLATLLIGGPLAVFTAGPLHGGFLLGAAGLLLWHRAGGGTPAVASVAAPGMPTAVALAAAVAFAVVVGRFGRFSWPASAAVAVVGIYGVGWAWRTRTQPAPEPLDRAGAGAWFVVFAALGIFELSALIMKSTLSGGPFAHPTLSDLMDSALVGPFGRTISVLAWLALGRFLVRR